MTGMLQRERGTFPIRETARSLPAVTPRPSPLNEDIHELLVPRNTIIRSGWRN